MRLYWKIFPHTQDLSHPGLTILLSLKALYYAFYVLMGLALRTLSSWPFKQGSGCQISLVNCIYHKSSCLSGPMSFCEIQPNK